MKDRTGEEAYILYFGPSLSPFYLLVIRSSAFKKNMGLTGSLFDLFIAKLFTKMIYKLALNRNISASMTSCVCFSCLSQQTGWSPGQESMLPLGSTRRRVYHHHTDNCQYDVIRTSASCSTRAFNSYRKNSHQLSLRYLNAAVQRWHIQNLNGYSMPRQNPGLKDLTSGSKTLNNSKLFEYS